MPDLAPSTATTATSTPAVVTNESAVKVSQEYIARWHAEAAPSSAHEWIKRAREVGSILQLDAVEREKANAIPVREVSLLKHAGLVTFLGPREFGGAGGTWETAYHLIREFVRSNDPGIKFKGDWDNLGQRLTESGGVTIQDVRVPWSAAAGWNAKTKSYEAIPYHTLTLPLIQLNFTNMYLGIAQGALEFAKHYSATKTRPWPAEFGGLGNAKGTDEWYLLENYGSLYATLRASESLIDDAGHQISQLAHSKRELVTAEQRAQIAVDVATAKVSIVDHGLYLTSKVFELAGARATANSVGLDRFWRNIRVHTLHDPIAYKKVEVGRLVLLDERPKPSWYT